MEEIDNIKIDITQDFEVLPEDVYKVVISDIKKVEVAAYKNPEVKETALNFEFTILEGEYEGRKLFTRIRPKLSLKPNPSNLYKLWKALEGREVPKEEFPNLHVSSFLNRTLKAITENKVVGDKTFTNISGYQYLAPTITDADIDEFDSDFPTDPDKQTKKVK